MIGIEAVVFDLDGVLLDSEHVWDEVREGLVRERGGRWHEKAQAEMMGMSSTEWSRYLHEAIGLADEPEEINAEVVRRMRARYAERLPLIEGALESVQRLAGAFRLGLASSSNRPLIDAVLAAAGLAAFFDVTVSSEEVRRGKPAPDVFLEAAARLGAEPEECAAIEDPRTAFALPTPPACTSSRSRTAATLHPRTPWRSRTSCSARSSS